MVTLNEAQITALARFNRNYAILKITLTEHGHNEDWIIVSSTLKAGKNRIERDFVLNAEGKLVRDESNAAHAGNLS